MARAVRTANNTNAARVGIRAALRRCDQTQTIVPVCSSDAKMILRRTRTCDATLEDIAPPISILARTKEVSHGL